MERYFHTYSPYACMALSTSIKRESIGFPYYFSLHCAIMKLTLLPELPIFLAFSCSLSIYVCLPLFYSFSHFRELPICFPSSSLSLSVSLSRFMLFFASQVKFLLSLCNRIYKECESTGSSLQCESLPLLHL